MQWSLAEGSGFTFPGVLDSGEKGEQAMTPTQMTTKLQNHQAASMEDTRYTMHSFRIRRAAGEHKWHGHDVLTDYVGRKPASVSRRYVKLTASAAVAGMKRSRKNGVHRG